MLKSELITIRHLRPEDMNFIYSTWLLGVYYGETIFKEMNKNTFMTNYHVLIDSIINAPNTEVLVACLKDDVDVIIGYAARNKNQHILYWVFVKKEWRKIGIATMLAGNEVTVATTLTKLGLSIVKKKQIEFDPFKV